MHGTSTHEFDIDWLTKKYLMTVLQTALLHAKQKLPSLHRHARREGHVAGCFAHVQGEKKTKISGLKYPLSCKSAHWQRLYLHLMR